MRDHQIDSQLDWLNQNESTAIESDVSLLLAETRGVCEKLAEANCRLFTHNLVLWQPRWIFAEIDGFCYQKVSVSEVHPLSNYTSLTFTIEIHKANSPHAEASG